MFAVNYGDLYLQFLPSEIKFLLHTAHKTWVKVHTLRNVSIHWNISQNVDQETSNP